MWESTILTSHGGNSMRRIFTYAVSALVAAFLWILIISPSVHAADATWDGSVITYDGHPYSETKATKTSKPSLPVDTTYYRYLEITMTGGLAHAIYFPNNNPTTASTAKYSVYTIDSSGNYGDQVTSQDISLVPKDKATAKTDATWKDGAIVYNSNTYSGTGSSYYVATGTNPSLPKGTKYYQYLDLSANKAYLIYFSASSDPPKEKSATYQTYDINTNLLGGNITWSNPSTAKTISITPINGTSSTGVSTSDSAATSCDVDGIGWIVCPVSNFLAWGMDNIFDLLKGFLVVNPLTTQTDNSPYQAWNYIRSIANVAFVIAFLIIIFSQLTSVGITNYGIKKLLPRLIIAAILVNVSYYICAIAIDLSNVIGDSLQQVLVNMRQSLDGPNTNDISSWQSITGFILSGGTLAAAAGVGLATSVIATGASVGAAIILLLPMLLGLLLAVLVALIVLAARQAVIMMLVIIAPLAFVAYLLPNTEKWFERWRSTFLTLLVFFPLFALIFGGSQLAGFLIIKNTNQINVILLGMFVQVAPLVLTPMLVKFSGNIVGKVAGLVNNPKKGLLDRTRNWAKDRSENMAARNMARTDPVRNRQIFRRYALGADQRRRIREGRKTMYGARTDARWANSADFRAIDQEQRFAQDQKSYGESVSERQYGNSRLVAGAIRNLDVNLKNVKVDIDTAHAQTEVNWEASHNPAIVERRLNQRVVNDSLATIKSTHDAQYEEFKAGRVGSLPATANVARMLYQAQDNTRLLALNGLRNSLAKQVQLETRTQQLITNTEIIDGQLLRTYAGGIHAQGADRALALALTEQHKARGESIANASAIIEHLNLDASETLEIAKNVSVKGVVVSDDIREAAIRRVGSNGVVEHIVDLLQSPSLDLSPAGNENFRITLVDALKNNSNRPKFIGLGILDQLTQGINNDVDASTIDGWIQGMLIDGKLSAKEMAGQDKQTLERISEAISRLPGSPALNIALGNLREEIANLKANDQLWDAAGERKAAINDIERKL